MRVLIWHGWLLEGSGSNIAAAKLTETLRHAGHDVLLLCQTSPAGMPGFIDQSGSVGEDAASSLVRNARAERDPSGGRAVLLRPDIGSLLPVFVMDEYEGFTVKRFVDLTDEELERYLSRNVSALRTAVAWQRPDLLIASHVVPGGVVAARALSRTPYVVLIHGSDLEYAVRLQDRYADLAREGMDRAAKVVGGSRDVVERALMFAPSASERVAVIAPGVDVERFRPRPRRRALEEAAGLLEEDPATTRGRDPAMARRLASVVGIDPDGPDRLARAYDQDAPDPTTASALRHLAQTAGPTVAYLGKLIPQKGVELFVQALALQSPDVRGVIIGFGMHREWLEALVSAIDAGGRDLEWIQAHSGLQIELAPDDLVGRPKLSERLWFTGRLDHRYVPLVLAAIDVLVVPSLIPEAFGMVAAEGAATGCLPLVALHSGLAEVAEALEEHVGRPGIFGFQGGAGATYRLAEGLRSLTSLPREEREELAREVSSFARSTWPWERVAARLTATVG